MRRRRFLQQASALSAKTLSCDCWRIYDIQDSLRFYALRFYEAGMIKSTPQKIIDRGPGPRIVNELVKELKA
jgi:NitT/TauT family transport system substrate-binding protein